LEDPRTYGTLFFHQEKSFHDHGSGRGREMPTFRICPVMVLVTVPVMVWPSGGGSDYPAAVGRRTR
jgi:hypothetical protein